MLKKSIVIAGGLALLLALFGGFSHLKTAFRMAKQSVKNSVPVEFEMKHARDMIHDLKPEIENNLRLIAQEEVEVAKLEDDVAASEERLAKASRDILRLKNDLDTGNETFVYAGKHYEAAQVKADLTARFDQYKTQEATLASKKKVLLARQNGLKAARAKLDGMLDAKRQLEVDIENLEARLAMVEVAQTTSDFKFDNSHLSRTQELVDEIATRVEVAEKLVNADLNYFERIPLDEPAADRDITEEIADYFGNRRTEIETFVKSAQ